ncbi:PREDICTED: PTB domain-containing engulfment adapter protein 1-like, partial [Rhagoletis zephyria]|uniref:PTB domain-containing engulfment adapter protein 1-like n=1 Tax=Rhagoletis zephyria TaxID=28612 RepID=UPI0008119648
MIKPTSLFKWPQNGAAKALDAKSAKQQQAQKLWIHPPSTLQTGHIAYLVKYFGNVEVSQPKGIEVVKESINKLKFIQPLKKSEGSKIPKVELTISVNGVAIQEPKSKKIYCQFPLHRISYCADDKTEKKFFSFIAKDVDTEKHLCFVFMSEKMSEEIILTIGQAFDLAYAKFIETSGRELEIRKQLILLQKKVCDLEEENKKLKERISKYEPSEKPSESVNQTKTLLSNSKSENGLSSKTTEKVNNTAAIAVPALQPPPSARNRNNSSSTQGQINLLDADLECHDTTVAISDQNLITDLLDQDFNPRAADKAAAAAAAATATATAVTVSQQPPPSQPENNSDLLGITQEKDIFGCEPFHVQDPFGMGQFSSGDLDSAIVSLDRKLAEMR